MKKNASVQDKEKRASEELQEMKNNMDETIQEPEDNMDGEDQEPESNIDSEGQNPEDGDQEPEDNMDGEDQEPESNIDSEGQNPEDGDQEPEEQEPEDTPKVLMAVYPILYHSHQYKIGDTLPANDPEMVKAWLDAGTAAWQTLGGESLQARFETAIPGLPGRTAGYGEGLVGRIPENGSRRK